MERDQNQKSLISSHVATYLKHCRNKDLSKYFRGTHATYMPEIQVEAGEPPQTSENEEKAGSPTSSLASNKKLEWDNGADIGYDNCSKSLLQKSTSLPSLPPDKAKKDRFSDKSKSTEKITVISRPSSSVSEASIEELLSYSRFKTLSSSSSSESVEEQIASTSARSSHRKEDAQSSSKSNSLEKDGVPTSSNFNKLNSNRFDDTRNLSYVKKKIGLPGAESTPNYAESTKPIRNIDQVTPKLSRQTESIVKTVNLCTTKAVFVECLDDKKVGSKKVQVHVTTSKEDKFVQTENMWTSPSKRTCDANQSIIFINCSSSTEKNIQTESDVACDSFEFLAGDELVKNDKVDSGKKSDNSSSVPKSSDNYSGAFGSSLQPSSSTKSSSGNSKYPDPKNGKSLEHSKSGTGSSKYPLGEVIALKQSKTLKDDVNMHLEALERLLKSKRYDKATKKRYIKKIVQKILDSTYIDDSTTSSEVFHPKRSKSDMSVSSATHTKQPRLQDNVPWYPAQMKNLVVKSFSDEIVPNIQEKDSIPQRGRFTLTNSQFIVNSSSSRSSENWKAEPTKSEKLWEKKRVGGQGDHLVNFASKERQHQINWINNEINHLSKLKVLLEKPVDKVPVKNTTTTVYMVQNTNPNRVPSCNRYVIETEIDSASTVNSDAMEFKLKDNDGETNYIVKEDASRGKFSRMRGNIEITSDEKSTKIKVRANNVEPKESVPITNQCSCDQEIQTSTWNKEVVSRSTQMSPNIRGVEELAAQRSHLPKSPESSQPTPRSPLKVKAGPENRPQAVQTSPPTSPLQTLSRLESTRPPANDLQELPEQQRMPKSNQNNFTQTTLPRNKEDDRIKRCRKCNKAKGDFKHKEAELNIWCVCDEENDKDKPDGDKDFISKRNKSPPPQEKVNKNNEQESKRRDVEQKTWTTWRSTFLKTQTEKVPYSPYKSEEELASYIANSDIEEPADDVQPCYPCDNQESKNTKRIKDKAPKLTDNRDVTSPKLQRKPKSGSKSPGSTSPRSTSPNGRKVATPERSKSPKPPEPDANLPESRWWRTKPDKFSRKLHELKDNQLVELISEPDATRIKKHAGSDKSDRESSGTPSHGAKRFQKDRRSLKKVTHSPKRDFYSGRPKTPCCPCENLSKAEKEQRSARNSHRLKSKAATRKDLKPRQRPITAESVFLKSSNHFVRGDELHKLPRNHKIKLRKPVSETGPPRNVDVEKRREENKRALKYSPDYTTESKDTTQDSNGLLNDWISISTCESKDDEESDRKMSSGNLSDGEESDDKIQQCFCCKKSSTTFKVMQQKLNHEAIQLCRPCYHASKKFGMGCHHMNDYHYTVIDTRKLNEIRKTVHNLNKMKNKHCTCKGKNTYCLHCKNKLLKTAKTKNGIAYSLTFETDKTKVKKRKKRHPMEEIKLLVPPHRGNSNSSNEKKSPDTAGHTLQDYLKINRPDFVEAAERRREHFIHAEDLDQFRENQRLAMLRNNRIFSEKEIREINKRICRNLPEIQDKILEHKQSLLKEANRLSAQIFNNKLRTSVLKGKVNVPIMTSVIEL